MAVSVASNFHASFDMSVSTSKPPSGFAVFLKKAGVKMCGLAGLKPKELKYSDIVRTDLATFKRSLRDWPTSPHLKFVTWNVMDPTAAESGLSSPRDLYPSEPVRVEKLVETLRSSLDAGAVGCLLQEAEDLALLAALRQAGLTVVGPGLQGVDKPSKQAVEVSRIGKYLQSLGSLITLPLHGHGLTIVFDGKKMVLTDPVKKPPEFSQYKNQKTGAAFLSELTKFGSIHLGTNASLSLSLPRIFSYLFQNSASSLSRSLTYLFKVPILPFILLPMQAKWLLNVRDNFSEVVKAASAFRPDGLLTCHLKDKRSGDQYILCTTHLESFVVDIQQKQIDELIEKLKTLRKENPKVPILVGGDFNQQGDHEALRDKLEKALGACVFKADNPVTFIDKNKELDKMFVIPPEGQVVEQADGQPWFVNHDSKHLSDHALLSGGFRYKG